MKRNLVSFFIISSFVLNFVHINVEANPLVQGIPPGSGIECNNSPDLIQGLLGEGGDCDCGSLAQELLNNLLALLSSLLGNTSCSNGELLTDLLQPLLISVGNLIDGLLGGGGDCGDLVQELLSNLLVLLTGVFGNTSCSNGELVSDLLQPLLISLGNLIDGLLGGDDCGGLVQDLLINLQALLTGLLGNTSCSNVRLLTDLYQSSLTSVGNLIDGLLEGDDCRDLVQDLLSNVQAILTGCLDDASCNHDGLLTDLLQPLLISLENLIDGLLGGDDCRDLVQDFLSNEQALLTSCLGNTSCNNGGLLTDILQSLLNSVENLIDGLLNGDDCGDLVQDYLSNAQALLTGLLSNISCNNGGLLTDLSQPILTSVENLIDGLLAGRYNCGGLVQDLLSNLLALLAGVFGNYSCSNGELLTDLLQPILTSVGNLIDGLVGRRGDYGNLVQELLSNLLALLTGLLGNTSCSNGELVTDLLQPFLISLGNLIDGLLGGRGDCGNLVQELLCNLQALLIGLLGNTSRIIYLLQSSLTSIGNLIDGLLDGDDCRDLVQDHLSNVQADLIGLLDDTSCNHGGLRMDLLQPLLISVKNLIDGLLGGDDCRDLVQDLLRNQRALLIDCLGNTSCNRGGLLTDLLQSLLTSVENLIDGLLGGDDCRGLVKDLLINAQALLTGLLGNINCNHGGLRMDQLQPLLTSEGNSIDCLLSGGGDCESTYQSGSLQSILVQKIIAIISKEQNINFPSGYVITSLDIPPYNVPSSGCSMPYSLDYIELSPYYNTNPITFYYPNPYESYRYNTYPSYGYRFYPSYGYSTYPISGVTKIRIV